MQKFILNIGHKTRSGGELTHVEVKNHVERFFKIGPSHVVVGEYEGIEEQTSVIHCGTDSSTLLVALHVNILAQELNQECIAVAELRDTVAVGHMYGDNPKGYVFSWALFRI